NGVRLDQRPRAVADRGDGFAGFREVPDERDGLRIYPQIVGVRDATRQDQRVELLGLGLLERQIDLQPVAFLVVVHPLNFARVRRDDRNLGAGLLQGLDQLRQLDLLHPSVASTATRQPEIWPDIAPPV